MAKVKIPDLQVMKRSGEKIVMVTAYDYPSALIVDRSGIEMILVGDSLGMVVLGYRNPIPVTMADIIHHTRAVSRGAERSLIIGDLPFMAYHTSIDDAIRNAGRIIKEGGADAVKLEGGEEVAGKVEAIVRVGIQVMAHIGLMPQRATISGGVKVQGSEAEAAKAIIDDALTLEAAGAFAVVLEFVTAEVAEIITEKLSIPTIGIGSGPHCDGQVLVLHDLLGWYESAPPFAKRYVNLHETMLEALRSYKDEVRKGDFPGDKHTVHMDFDELEKLSLMRNKKTE